MYFLFVDKIKKDADQDRFPQVIPGHIQWIEKQMEAGHLVQAGRWGEIGGMMVFRGDDEAAIRALLSQDPLVASGLIEWDLAPYHPHRDIY